MEDKELYNLTLDSTSDEIENSKTIGSNLIADSAEPKHDSVLLKMWEFVWKGLVAFFLS